MNKKIIFIIFLSFLLCGCTANYNLSINDGTITENLNVISIPSPDVDNYINNNTKYPTPAKKSQKFDKYTDEKLENVDYYDVKKIQKDGLVGLDYKYDFTFTNYNDSNIMNSCFEYFKVINGDNMFTISTSKGNKCMNEMVDVLNVNISTNYLVVDSNADTVNGHTYSWKINRDNYKDKNIYIKLNTVKRAEKTEEEIEQEENILKIFATVGIILIVFVVITVFVLMNKKRKLEN